jgi:hypothetical protein
MDPVKVAARFDSRQRWYARWRCLRLAEHLGFLTKHDNGGGPKPSWLSRVASRQLPWPAPLPTHCADEPA